MDYLCLQIRSRKGSILSNLKSRFLVNLYKKYTYLKLKDLEELPRFRVMSWQPCYLLCSVVHCFQVTLFGYEGIIILLVHKARCK